ncbi:unnamed protein product [Somion occarium]|uniref:Ceramide very long chain fatty acid hydroxylase n=1 Tax=Somion occarium TaxID=3059160 RepID=A0ABP1DQ29_9APHY
MSKRIRIFTEEDLAQHCSPSSCWVSRNGKVYDVTSFILDHPGGDDLILNYAGKDVGAVMKDPEEHEHSDSAYDMLDEYIIGRVGAGENIVSDDWVPAEDFHPEETDTSKDFERNQFLDLRKPVLRQVWQANFSKSYYLQQVHQPRHLSESARMFGPAYLEVFTRTQCVPPFFADPSAPLRIIFSMSIPAVSFAKATACFFLGNVVWTILEYTLHRFLFHIDYYLPDHPLRLVMPPLLFTTLSYPFTQLAHAIFPTAVANGTIAGAFAFYVLYDCMHYALHHTRLPAYMREMKKYHLAHHYKNFDLGFGVTSKIWDYVFNTVLPV